MHVQRILHDLLLTSIHKTRINTLKVLITGLINSKELKLTALGRSLPGTGNERAGILRVNRLLSNRYYQAKSSDIYKCITRYVIRDNSHPDILVDWSSLPNSHYTTKGGEHCVLKACYAASGRSITLYEEVHPKSQESNPWIHKEFLKNLRSILPKDCVPCIITDAGFKTPWFKVVLNLGWNYVGRVSCGTSSYDDGEGFKKVTNLFDDAKNIPKFIGNYILTLTNKLPTNFYMYKNRAKGRHKWTRTAPKKISKDKATRKNSKANREPWVLVSSFHGEAMANIVIKKYKSRMTIEENIRDTKSVKTGLSMNENKTINSERYIVWLMLAALATLIAWIVGFAAEQQKFHYAFQANTYRHRRVLSFFYLGCQMIRKKINFLFDIQCIKKAAWED